MSLHLSKRVAAAVGLLAALFILGGCQPAAHQQQASGAQAERPDAAKFHCPMHPTYVSDRPGDCPICHMKLVPIRESGATAAGAGVPGRATIALSPEKRQLIGLTLATVEERELTTTVRAPGVVSHDERRYARISPRFGGWVRELYADFVSAPVEAGKPLFTAYSPEVFAAESDYLIARRALHALPQGAPAPQREAAEALLESARLRLALWEIGDEEIRAIEERDAPSRELVYRSPLSGHVLVKNAVEGQAFMAGDTLFEIADLSHLWLQVLVSETDLPRLAPGQEAMVTFASLGNLVFDAEVTFIDPHLDEQTRRGTVRLELDNPGLNLLPGMWAEVEIEIPLGRKLTVPADAVIDTGRRFLAFVDGEAGHLEPREVKVGAKVEEFYEVRAGLAAGERVVSRALFLVDSESQLRAAIAGMGEAGAHQH